jgi:hypothetical protein
MKKWVQMLNGYLVNFFKKQTKSQHVHTILAFLLISMGAKFIR